MCCDVGVEPALLPLNREPLQYATANREDGARLDVVARDFWGQNRQHAFFDVRVFNPLRTPIPAPHCQSATKFMNRRNVELMMNLFGK